MSNQSKAHQFTTATDLKKWSTMGIVTIQGQPNTPNKADIYNYLIYPLFQSNKQIKQIHFLSTSLWWGHKSLGKQNLDRAFDIISNNEAKNRIKIIMNTDLGNLFNMYSNDLINKMDDFSRIFEGEVRFSKKIGVNDYKMLICTNSNEYYKITFLNEEKQNGVLKFSGKIKVTSLNDRDYAVCLKRFNKIWNNSSLLDEKKLILSEFGSFLNLPHMRFIPDSIRHLGYICTNSFLKDDFKTLMTAACTTNGKLVTISSICFLEKLLKHINTDLINCESKLMDLIQISKDKNFFNKIPQAEIKKLSKLRKKRNLIIHDKIILNNTIEETQDTMYLVIRFINSLKYSIL